MATLLGTGVETRRRSKDAARRPPSSSPRSVAAPAGEGGKRKESGQVGLGAESLIWGSREA